MPDLALGPPRDEIANQRLRDGLTDRPQRSEVPRIQATAMTKFTGFDEITPPHSFS